TGAPAARLESRVGVPAEQILAAAADLHPTLLAMGWPHGGPERGSVVREVLDRTPVPVLLVGLAEAPVAAGAAPAGWPSAQP
ncbi:MAG TPA: universal stress protein, partial [Acidimicrobiales bacterium]|nr:universal stress protein [Acidimicrobiales bacterium]